MDFESFHPQCHVEETRFLRNHVRTDPENEAGIEALGHTASIGIPGEMSIKPTGSHGRDPLLHILVLQCGLLSNAWYV